MHRALRTVRVALVAPLLAYAAMPAFAQTPPALPPGFPSLSSPIIPAATTVPSPTPSVASGRTSTAPAYTPTLPPGFPALTDSILPPPTPTATLAPAAPSALPAGFPNLATPILGTPASATPGPDDAVPPLYVKGQVLAISAGFFIFTSGDSLRLASGVVIPPGVTTGSYVRVAVDQLSRTVTAIELEPHTSLSGEIDAANVPRQYVVVSPKSAPLPSTTGQTSSAGNALVTITIVVHIPANTPTSEDVYLATDRSQYSPSEVRMDRIDGATFSTAVSIPGGTTLKYQFTRGTYSTVERDRTGGIVPARLATATPNLKTDDTVVRWADLS